MKRHTGWWIPLAVVLGAPAVWAAPSGGMPEMPARMEAPPSPEEQAKRAYNSGLDALKKADALEATAAKETDKKRDKAQAKAQKAYSRARDKFQEATELSPRLAEAWNSLGYSQRKLGSHAAALAAYDQALSLKPGYAEALEYRGEAYLGLNRVEDAKQAYLDLFAANRMLSQQLLTSMKSWIETRRQSPGDVDAATISDLEKWIQERSQIAAQTAALTREGTAAGWR
jgi:tetratricopeptide (TPR) repeat protein